jgi:tetratricopeptide (TPR) repeat protein
VLGRQLLGAGLVLALVAAGAVVALPSLLGRRDRPGARWLVPQGHFADTEPLLRRALERNPNDLDVIRALARGHHDAGQLAEAEPYLGRWCDLRPGEAEPFQRRLDVRHKLGRLHAPTQTEKQRLLQAALADGQRALELEPNNEPVAQEVIWLLLSAGRFEEAERACRRGLSRQPGHPWLLFLLAKAYHGQGANALAQKVLDPLVRDQPGFADGLLLRAILYREADQPAQAIPLLRQVLALGRGHQQETLYQLSLALARTGQAEEAQRVMAERQLLGLEKQLTTADYRDNPAFRVWVAETRLGAGKSEEARRLLEKVLEEDPDYTPAHRLLAAHYEKQGQADKAAEHRRRVAR